MYSSQSDTQERGVSVANHSEQSNTRSWKTFADLINASWRKGAEAFLQTGRYLIEAKEQLEREEYGALIKLRLAFDQSVAKKLICVASNPLLGAHVHQLPPCWSTLYELTKLGDDVLKAALADGAIHPGMKRKDAIALRHPEIEGNGQAAAETASPETESISTLDALANAWEAASQSDRCTLFDRLGCAKLVAAMSDKLKSDFRDHIIKQMIATASKSSDFAVQSTARLHCMLRCAEQKEPSAEDIKYMTGAGRAMLCDAEKRGIPRSNILITEGEPQRRKPKK